MLLRIAHLGLLRIWSLGQFLCMHCTSEQVETAMLACFSHDLQFLFSQFHLFPQDLKMEVFTEQSHRSSIRFLSGGVSLSASVWKCCLSVVLSHFVVTTLSLWRFCHTRSLSQAVSVAVPVVGGLFRKATVIVVGAVSVVAGR
jgi:hypothetical protein